MIRRNLIASIAAAPLAGALALLPLSDAQAYTASNSSHLEQATPHTSAHGYHHYYHHYGYNPAGAAFAGAALGVVGAIAGASSCYNWGYYGCYGYPATYGYGYGYPSYGYSGGYYSGGWGGRHWGGRSYGAHYGASPRFSGGSRVFAHAGGGRRVR